MSQTITDVDRETDLAGMERWTAWVIELLDHATRCAEDVRDQVLLEGAAEDAATLRRVLGQAVSGQLDEEQTLVLRSIYALWDANQGRFERMAASVDSGFHHHWMMRSASGRLNGDGTPLTVNVRERQDHAAGSGQSLAVASSAR